MPSKPGVYLYHGKDGTVLYVGKAKDLKSRVSSYFTSPQSLGVKTRLLVEQIDSIEIVIVESEIESLLLEAYYIKKFRPRYNIRLTDDKSYPLIKITTNEPYPSVLFARKMDDTRAQYFGPYPSSGAVKLVLKTLRKAFPYVAVNNHPRRVCLYYHLGLCPCPPVFDTADLKKEYKAHIKNIIRILEGKSQSVVKELEKEMGRYSSEEKFEEASALKRKIDALRVITEPTRKPFEYDVNPNLRTDMRAEELNGLQEVLTASGLRVERLSRIECYDISNIQGTNATGSLVVLTDGEIDKSQYRKFKIKQDGKPNDFAMMKEMLQRRLNHLDWPDPSLVVIDGGKGQVSSVLEAMTAKNRHFPVVGLAKREETLIVPLDQLFYSKAQRRDIPQRQHKLYGDKEDNFIEISLPKNSPSLHLVERIRNEAHRFAITYHRKLRSDAALSENGK